MRYLGQYHKHVEELEQLKTSKDNGQMTRGEFIAAPHKVVPAVSSPPRQLSLRQRIQGTRRKPRERSWDSNSQSRQPCESILPVLAQMHIFLPGADVISSRPFFLLYPFFFFFVLYLFFADERNSTWVIYDTDLSFIGSSIDSTMLSEFLFILDELNCCPIQSDTTVLDTT